MAAYLIDYENVKSEGIRGILQLCEQDSVIIFYSHNADTLTFETMDMIFGSKATVRKYKIVRGGKNALDFQLSTYLGYLIHEGKDSCFYIISKDNGFQHVVEFWKRTFNYDGYVYCFPTIADAYAKQRRFDTVSAKERAAAAEEDMIALQEAADAEEPENPVVSGVFEEDISAEEEYVEEETVFDEPDTEDYVPTEEDSIEEEKSQPIITITSHEDNFIIEAIHEDSAVAPVEPAASAAKSAQIPVFSESLAEKIAAAVPDSWLKVTVVENNVTVHQVPEETETIPAVTDAKPQIPESTVAETAKTASDDAEPPVPETESLIPETEMIPAAETASVSQENQVAEETEKTTPKKKSRQASRKKPAPKNEDSFNEAQEPAAEPEPVSESSAEAQEDSSEETIKPARRKSSHHGGRRKKAQPAAVSFEQEAAPAAVSSSSEEKDSERKPHHAHTGGQRGRRPKTQKSEAAAFTD